MCLRNNSLLGLEIERIDILFTLYSQRAAIIIGVSLSLCGIVLASKFHYTILEEYLRELMDDQSLWCRVNVTLIEIAPVDTFPTTITTPANVELEFSEIRHLMISIERAQEHHLVQVGRCFT